MRLTALIAAAFLTACNTASDIAEPTEPDAGAPLLEQVWLTSGFSSPEGVAVYNDTLLISNAVGEGAEKDGEGWISRVAMDGTMLEEKWVEGLNAPKGMAVSGNILFVADIDSYHTIDADTGRILNTFSVLGGKFLNDVTVWNTGVFASDSQSASIHQLDENGSKLWLQDDRMDGINGLLGDGENLLISTMDEGLLLSTDNGNDLTEIARGMTHADGIAVLGNGEYLVSSWRGRIWHVAGDGTVTALLDTEADGILQNDLTGVGDLIIVPNWQPGTVTAWRLVD